MWKKRFLWAAHATTKWEKSVPSALFQYPSILISLQKHLTGGGGNSSDIWEAFQSWAVSIGSFFHCAIEVLWPSGGEVGGNAAKQNCFQWIVARDCCHFYGNSVPWLCFLLRWKVLQPRVCDVRCSGRCDYHLLGLPASFPSCFVWLQTCGRWEAA